MTPNTEKQIEFTPDRETWHDGMAIGGDLFYRTRTVIDGEPTKWREFLMPACFIGTPIWMVWEMIKDLNPYPLELYEEFLEVLEQISAIEAN